MRVKERLDLFVRSVLQFMSGEKVLRVLESPRFLAAFATHCPDVPIDSMFFLISLNLGVAKSLSGLDAVGPVVDWIEKEKARTGQASQ